MYHVPLAFQCIRGCIDAGDEKEDGSEISGRRECVASCMQMTWFCFVEVCRRRGLKVNADKSKAMMLNGEEGLSVRFV